MKIPKELDDYLFPPELSSYRMMVLEDLEDLSKKGVELLLLSIEVKEDAIYFESLISRVGEKELSYHNNSLLTNYIEALYIKYYKNYPKQLPKAQLQIVINILFTGDDVTDYMVSIQEKAPHKQY